jgi:uncharacterized membrane protein
MPEAAGVGRPGPDFSRLPPDPAIPIFAALLLLGCFQPETSGQPKPPVTEGALADVAYAPAKRLVGRYCSDCHARNGGHENHADAWGHALRLDSHEEWVEARNRLLERLDSAVAAEQDPPVDVMPQAAFPLQPTRAERDTLLDWIRRGSPNTPSGE